MICNTTMQQRQEQREMEQEYTANELGPAFNNLNVRAVRHDFKYPDFVPYRAPFALLSTLENRQ